jgi:hypothetical protein
MPTMSEENHIIKQAAAGANREKQQLHRERFGSIILQQPLGVPDVFDRGENRLHFAQ